MLKNTVDSGQEIKAKIRQVCDLLIMPVIVFLGLNFHVWGQGDFKLGDAPSPCARIGKSSDIMFITYEGGPVRNREGKRVVTLRMRNNSTCSVMITAGSSKGFEKPLSANPTLSQVAKREIEYVLPDNVLVPQLQYKYNSKGKERVGVGGDMFFGFYILPNHSILFEVIIEHLGELNLGNVIAVPFQYSWEAQDQSGNIYPSVENRVLFWTDALPPESQDKTRVRTRQKK